MSAINYSPPSRVRTAFTQFVKYGFGSPLAIIISLIVFSLLIYTAWLFIDWAFINSVWTQDEVARCGDATGACWSVIDARHRLILYGTYPYEEHWRSTLAAITIVAIVLLSCLPAMWRTKRLAILWIAGFATYYLLMEGSLLGLNQVSTDGWGGLSLTLFLFAAVVLLGMPMGLGLALMRRSEMPVVQWFAIIVIDTIRSLPLVTTLFTAAVVAPLFLPTWLESDKIWRVIFAFALFYACYQAEVFRGGFQAVAKGQFEAGKALGLNYRRILSRIVLPQVFRHSLPGTINMIVITFKETAIVTIIGFFDILASGKTAFGTADWAPYYIEVYLFVAAIYWIFIFSLGQYGEFLKRRMALSEQ